MALTGLPNGLNNIASIIFILLSWGAVILGIIKNKSVHRSNSIIYMFISLSAALFAVLFQTFEAAFMVVLGDLSAVEDVVPYMTIFYLIFVVITVILNYILIRTQKRTSYN